MPLFQKKWVKECVVWLSLAIEALIEYLTNKPHTNAPIFRLAHTNARPIDTAFDVCIVCMTFPLYSLVEREHVLTASRVRARSSLSISVFR